MATGRERPSITLVVVFGRFRVCLAECAICNYSSSVRSPDTRIDTFLNLPLELTASPSRRMPLKAGQKKRLHKAGVFFQQCYVRGERDSNPRYSLEYTRLAGEPVQPLRHLPRHFYEVLRRRREDSNLCVRFHTIRFQVGAVRPLRHASIGSVVGTKPLTTRVV